MRQSLSVNIMAQLPKRKTTIDVINEKMELANNADPAPFRGHLGASSIGRECERQLWYAFRGIEHVKHHGRMLRLFERGHNEEPSLVKYLQMAGVTVHDTDADGEQFRYSDIGGHFAGSMDGAGKGFIEAPKTWHVLEFKTSSQKYFNPMVKHGVEKSKPEHFAQMQMYMSWSKMKRAFYLMVNKNDDTLYSERVKYDSSIAKGLTEKARRIITSQNPPAKISEDPSWYKCKFCDFPEACHRDKQPTVTCRTCLHSTPETDGEDGRWSCNFHDIKSLTKPVQTAGCYEHRYIPKLVTFAVAVNASADENYVEYELPNGRKFRNGRLVDGGFSSGMMNGQDLAWLDIPEGKRTTDDLVESLKTQYIGELEV